MGINGKSIFLERVLLEVCHLSRKIELEVSCVALCFDVLRKAYYELITRHLKILKDFSASAN